jgi:hypothetical protein
MDNMVADIERGYDLKSEDPPPKVQNFYRLLAASKEKNARWHQCDYVTGCYPSYVVKIKVLLLESVLQRYREVCY